MKQLFSLLARLGLEEKEIKVFLSLIKLGAATATQVSRDTSITRTLIYDIMERLKSRGIVSESVRHGVKMFVPLDHAGLIAYISKKRDDLLDLQQNFTHAANEFHALQKERQQKTDVRFFSGPEGVRSVYEEIMGDFKKTGKAGDEVFTVFSPTKLETSIPGWSNNTEYFSTNRNIKNYHIMCESEHTQIYLDKIRLGSDYHEWRFWKNELGQFPTDTLCWKNKIVYVDLEGYPSGIIIENESITTSFKMWFWQIWKSLEPGGKNKREPIN